ncbi:hypothetical protein FY150_19750 [Agrobacterium tumefaciens]|nr:hypothetical protein FY150_19750 [Agrobacterium tumefaciens]
MAAEIISLGAERARRSNDPPVDPAFAQAWMLIFDALELVEDMPMARAQAAYDKLYEGLRILLNRERDLRRG